MQRRLVRVLGEITCAASKGCGHRVATGSAWPTVASPVMSQRRSDKSRKRQHRKQQREARRAQPHLPHPVEEEPGDLDLMVQIDHALAEPHPLVFLQLVSGIVAALDPRRSSPFDQPDDDATTLDDIIESFLGVELPQTTAALRVLAAILPNDLTAARLRRELADRQHRLPSWLGQLGDTEVHGAVEMSHVLGDGVNINLGTTLPGGHEMTAVVYIDHNLGTVVKDAFLLDQSLDTVVSLYMEQVPDPDTVFVEVDLADARTKITDAVETGVRTFPPFESDTWPMCRPLVEWLARSLPIGGSGYERPEWSQHHQQQLAESFFASPYGAGLDDEDRRSMLESLLWFGTDYATGDPLRWSPVSVELLLVDWIPRKIVADAEYLSIAPDLLRAFIGYAHDRAGVRTGLTEETLQAVDHYEPQYQQLIRSPRLQGPEALMAVAGLLADELDGDLPPYGEAMLDTLRRDVGGDEALRSLDEALLPDEPFDWTRIPEDIRGRVEEVLTLVDACCDELLDTEYRTACRRLLADVAGGDPAVFRRAGAARTAAAAVCWIIGRANDLFGGWGSGVQVRELMAPFDVKGSPSQRAATLLRAAGIDYRQYGVTLELGSPRYLVSARRAELIAQRDGWLAMLG